MVVKRNHKHDTAAKAMFGLGTNAHEFFVAVMPAQLRDMLDLEQMQPLSEALHSGNGSRTRELRLDLLYEVPARAGTITLGCPFAILGAWIWHSADQEQTPFGTKASAYF